jgi:2-phospho-L-lactate transferase/gluconeogenesis factor (CofD/UPF0052 family)
MAVLLIPGIAEAWQNSRAQRLFVLNLIDQQGETLGLTGADHLRMLASIGGIGGPGIVVAHEGPISTPTGHHSVVVDSDTALAWGWDVASEALVDQMADWPEHDVDALGRALRRFVDSASA